MDRDDVLSIYLDVDPTLPDHQRHPPAYAIWLKNSLDALEIDGTRDEVLELRTRKESLVSDVLSLGPRGKGLAVFSAPDLDIVFDLPMPVDNRIHHGRPHVTPLLWLLDEYERYGIVQVDGQAATLWTAFLGRARMDSHLAFELDTGDWRRKDLMPATSAGRMLGQGSHRDAHAARVDEQRRHFHRSVADEMRRWVDDLQLTRLVVGGDEQTAFALREALSSEVSQRMIGVVPLPRDDTESELLERVLDTAVEHERSYESALVADIMDAALGGGRAALGPGDVLAALQDGRARLVTAAWPVTGAAWRCRACPQLFDHAPQQCSVCGGDVEETKLSILLPELAADRGAELEFVHGEAAEALAPHGGLAAALRY